MAHQIEGSLFVDGDLAPKTMSYPNASIDNSHVDGSSDGFVDAATLTHRHELTYGQLSGVDVASETKLLHGQRGASSLIADIRIFVDTAPTGGDKQFTVDLQKADSSNDWASILQEEVTIDSTRADGDEITPSLNDTDFAADDLFRVVVTASGSTGSQGQGFQLSVFLDEIP